MKWKKFKIKTVTDAEDIIISTLYDIGLEGAQIEDKVPLTAAEKEQMFVDILPEGPADDGIAWLSFFVEETEDGRLQVNGGDTDEQAVMESVQKELDGLRVFCDIGDGQSIAENLSTFSAHIKNIIRILEKTDEESLVLLDELGSGTDPAEGMGIAVAVLEELRTRGCLFVVTTHYPEVKEYGERAEGVMNARMAFDKESLKPLYRLELGESGESCAFYIARRLGMAEETLEMAWKAAYGNGGQERKALPDIIKEIDGERGQGNPDKARQNPKTRKVSRIRSREDGQKAGNQRKEDIKDKFHMGDSVMVYPQRKLGIVFAPADDKGDVGVQIQKRKLFVNYKRLQRKVAASEMYPEDYDFSIIFDTVENRKARHQMDRKYVPDMEIKYEKEEE